MSVNNPDKLDTLFKKLEKDIESGKFLEYLKEIDRKEKERKEYVNNKEFFEWLAEFVDKLHKMRRTYSTEDFYIWIKINSLKKTYIMKII